MHPTGARASRPQNPAPLQALPRRDADAERNEAQQRRLVAAFWEREKQAGRQLPLEEYEELWRAIERFEGPPRYKVGSEADQLVPAPC